MPRSGVSAGGAAVALLLCVLVLPLCARAQVSGQLTVSATIQSSISLVFVDNPNVGQPGYCPLTNSGTNNVLLNLGGASHPGGATFPCVAFQDKAPQSYYQVSSAFDVLVSKANSSSASYRLAVSLSAVPPANVTWMLNSTALTTSPQTLQAANAYGRTTETLGVQVKYGVPAQLLTETIYFTANAN